MRGFDSLPDLMFYVYTLKSNKNGDLYIGFSENLKQRFNDHNIGKVQATKPNRPWTLIYYEAYRNKKDATKREKQLKMHRAKDDLKMQIANSFFE